MHETAATALSPFDIAAILVVAAAIFGYLNHHFIRLPHVIGLTVMGALAAILLMVVNALVPAITLDDSVSRLLEQMNFTETLLEGMLSFLLFAGAFVTYLAQRSSRRAVLWVGLVVVVNLLLWGGGTPLRNIVLNVIQTWGLS